MKSLIFLLPSLFIFQMSLAGENSVSAREFSRRQHITNSALNKFFQMPKLPSSTKATELTSPAEADTRSVSPAEINACLISTCGDSPSNFTAWNILEPRKVESVTFKNIWDNDLGPLIQADMSDERNFNSELISLLPDGMKASSLTEDQIRVLKSFLTFKNLGASLISFGSFLIHMDINTGVITLDEAKLSQYAKAVGPDQGKALQFLARRLLLPGYQISDRLKYNSPLSARLKVFYPGVKDRAALIQDAQKLTVHYKDIQIRYGRAAAAYLVGMSESEKQSLSAAAKGAVLNGSDADLYVLMANNIDFYHLPIETEALELFPKLNTSFDTIFARAKGNFISNMQSLDKIFDLNSAIQETQNLCRKNLALQDASDVSEFKRARAGQMIGEIKAAAKALLPRFVSQENVAAIATAIDKTRFVMPPKNDIGLQKFRAKILRHRDFIAEQRNFLKSGSAEVDNFLAVTSVIRTQMQLETKAKLLEDSIKTDCDIETQTFTDFAVPAFDQVNVSWASLAFPEYSIGILSHELGHIVSGEIRTLGLTKPKSITAFTESLNCVANRNPFQEDDVKLSKFENTEWSEEDWADHFSAFVMTDLKKRKSIWIDNSKNIGCALVAGEGKEYGLNGINPTPGDVHTAPLMRMFMIESDRGQQTPACQSLYKPDTCN